VDDGHEFAAAVDEWPAAVAVVGGQVGQKDVGVKVDELVRVARPPPLVQGLADLALGVDPQPTATGRVADRVDRCARPRRGTREGQGAESVGQPGDLDDGQVRLRFPIDYLAREGVLLPDLVEEVVDPGDQFAVLILTFASLPGHVNTTGNGELGLFQRVFEFEILREPVT
jgi:hypothetical protein